MLSFFRNKSTETSVDKIINATKNLVLQVDEIPIDAATMDTNTDESNANANTKTKTTYTMQAYENDAELKDAIFGMTGRPIFISVGIFQLLFFSRFI